MTYQRRTVGIVAAIVLALLGTLGLVGYVQGAKDEPWPARSWSRSTSRATRSPRERRSSRLADLVKTEKVPAKVRANDAVDDLKAVKGEVTSIDLARRRAARDEPLRPRRRGSSSSHDQGRPRGHLRRAPSRSTPSRRSAARCAPVTASPSSASTNANGADAGHGIADRQQRARHQRADRRQQRRQTRRRRRSPTAPTGKFFVTFALTQADLEKVVSRGQRRHASGSPPTRRERRTVSGLLVASPSEDFDAKLADVFGGDAERSPPLLAGRSPRGQHGVDRRRAHPHRPRRRGASGPDLDDDAALDLVEAFDAHRPDVTVIIVAEPSLQLLERALRSGARDVVAPDAPGHRAARGVRPGARRRRPAPHGLATRGPGRCRAGT